MTEKPRLSKEMLDRIYEVYVKTLYNQKGANAPPLRQSTCTCDTCDIMDSALGKAMMRFIEETRKVAQESIHLGAPDDYVLEMDLNGPKADAIAAAAKGRYIRNDQQGYTHVKGSLREYADLKGMPSRYARPDTKAIREMYENDPLVTSLCDWLDRVPS